jgi:hypothetical protein
VQGNFIGAELAAKALLEQQLHIVLVVDNQNMHG